MATHSSVLAWRIPGAGKSSGLTSLGLHRVGHDWSDLAAAAKEQSSLLTGLGRPTLMVLELKVLYPGEVSLGLAIPCWNNPEGNESCDVTWIGLSPPFPTHFSPLTSLVSWASFSYTMDQSLSLLGRIPAIPSGCFQALFAWFTLPNPTRLMKFGRYTPMWSCQWLKYPLPWVCLSPSLFPRSQPLKV